MQTRESPWIGAKALENYASLHEFSLWNAMYLPGRVHVQFDFNIATPFHIDPRADITFKTRDADEPIDPNCCFSITPIKRWRLYLEPYSSFESFINSLVCRNRRNYTQSKRLFEHEQCSITLIENDWSEHVDTVYNLYCNVAQAHRNRLYDLSFFHKIAKQKGSKLLCAWLEGTMIGVFILQEEPSIIHATYCGLDYAHSSHTHTYTWLCFKLIELGITTKKYECVDIGFTADQAKQAAGFSLIPMRLDIYAKNKCVRGFLRLCSTFVKATITPDAQLKFRPAFLKEPFSE